MFGRKSHVVERDAAAESDAPFQLQFAPGVMVVDAEIRDRASLGVLIAGLQAFGALLPENPPSPALPPPVEPAPAPAAVVEAPEPEAAPTAAPP